MIGRKAGIRGLWNTEERQQNDPSSHKDRGERGCHYLSMGMTDWNSSVIASSILRTDRNLGTPPTKGETCFRAYLKSPPMFLRAFARSQMGGFLLVLARQSPSQARFNQSRKKQGNYVDFISIYALSRVIQNTATWAMTHICSKRTIQDTYSTGGF